MPCCICLVTVVLWLVRSLLTKGSLVPQSSSIKVNNGFTFTKEFHQQPLLQQMSWHGWEHHPRVLPNKATIQLISHRHLLCSSSWGVRLPAQSVFETYVSSQLLLHFQPLSPSLFSSSQLLILPHGGPFEELFSLWPITRVISSRSAPLLAGHHSAPPPGGTPNPSRQHNHPSRQAEGCERRDNKIDNACLNGKQLRI